MNCRKFPKFPYRGGKFSKVGNYCGNLSLPSGNLLVLDLVTLSSYMGGPCTRYWTSVQVRTMLESKK